MQMNTTMRYPYTPMWMVKKQTTDRQTKPKKLTIPSVGKDTGKQLKRSYIASENAKCSHPGKLVSYNMTEKFHS